MSARNLTLMVALSLSFAAPGMASQIGDTPWLSGAQVEGALKTGFSDAGATCAATARGDEGFTPGAVCMGQTEQCGGVRTVFERVGDRYRIHFQFRDNAGHWRYGPRSLTLYNGEEILFLMAEGMGIQVAGSVSLAFVGSTPVAAIGALAAWDEEFAFLVMAFGTALPSSLVLSDSIIPDGAVRRLYDWLQSPGADMYRGAAASRPWTAIGRERQACIADYLMGVSRLAQTVSTGGTPTAADFAAAAGRSTSGARATAPVTDGPAAADSASD